MASEVAIADVGRAVGVKFSKRFRLS